MYMYSNIILKVSISIAVVWAESFIHLTVRCNNQYLGNSCHIISYRIISSSSISYHHIGYNSLSNGNTIHYRASLNSIHVHVSSKMYSYLLSELSATSCVSSTTCIFVVCETWQYHEIKPQQEAIQYICDLQHWSTTYTLLCYAMLLDSITLYSIPLQWQWQWQYQSQYTALHFPALLFSSLQIAFYSHQFMSSPLIDISYYISCAQFRS